jgi:hypothetical protein
MIAAICVPAATAGQYPAGEQVRVISAGEHPGPVRGQEREHAAVRDQVPGQHLSVQKLPVCALEALHETIILDHRTPSRQTRRHLGLFQQPPSLSFQ